MTCTCSMRPGRSGAYSDRDLTTVSPRSLRRPSQFDSDLKEVLPSAETAESLKEANWTYAESTCLPSGARAGSRSVGIVTSRYGEAENSPYLEASNARSR